MEGRARPRVAVLLDSPAASATNEILATLMKEYTRIMLVRSRAAAILKQRGHDVSRLVADDEPYL